MVKEACRRLVGQTPGRWWASTSRGTWCPSTCSCSAARAAPGQDRRDGDRRGQDAGRHHAALLERAHRPRRPPGHGERLPRAPRRRMDGARSTSSSASRWAASRTRWIRRRGAPRTPATSPTAPTTSSGSTTCATTWRAPRAARAARLRLRDRRRGRLGADRRGAHAAHHLRAGRAHAPEVRRAQAAGRARRAAADAARSTSRSARREAVTDSDKEYEAGTSSSK